MTISDCFNLNASQYAIPKSELDKIYYHLYQLYYLLGVVYKIHIENVKAKTPRPRGMQQESG